MNAISRTTPMSGPATPTDRVRAALRRMLSGPVAAPLQDVLVRHMLPFGAGLVERLADNGLRIAVTQGGFAHYDAAKKTVTYPVDTLDRDTDPPLRQYVVQHELAHAMDFLFEPARGPLSERSDLGIAAHRSRLGEAYRVRLAEFETEKRRLEREGRWGPPPSGRAMRAHYEDFATVVEAVTDRPLAERPARGHVTILDVPTRPTEYFADSVYCFLHSDPLKSYNYTLPNGEAFSHAYPPNRAMLATRDPKMHAALMRFFSGGAERTSDLKIN